MWENKLPINLLCLPNIYTTEDSYNRKAIKIHMLLLEW